MASLITGTKAATSTASTIGTPTLKRTLLAIHSPAGAAATVYLGGSNVDATNGIPIVPGDQIFLTNDGHGAHASHDWYVYAASSVTLQYTEAT
jgi:hypothetical protein